MKPGFVRLICLAALFLFTAGSTWAQGFHQLTIDDFKGVPRNEQYTVAYTNCSIGFHYQAHREKNYYML
ncbi:MAG: hypothetical protein ABI113_23505, partial [Mucilaginibacter sp.]